MMRDIGAILKDVADEMLEGLQLIGPDWRYLYVNETVARQGRRRKEDLLGKTMMECYPGIERTPLFQQLRRVMGERASVTMENEFTYPDGTSAWFLLCIRPSLDGIVIFSVDIGERKKAEDALRAKLAELDQAVSIMISREARMAELKSTIQQLRSLVDAQGAPVVTPASD